MKTQINAQGLRSWKDDQLQQGPGKSNGQLIALSRGLMRVEQDLIRSVSSTLHDHLGQTLTAISFTHQAILNLQASDVPSDIASLQVVLGQYIAQALLEIRHVLMDLFPPLLEDNGLAFSLENELRSRGLQNPELEIVFFAKPDFDEVRYPTQVAYATFMVAREALQNVVKHANATQVVVTLEGDAKGIDLTVVDNGNGILLSNEPSHGRLGILGMQERAMAVNALVKVSPNEPSGCVMRFQWFNQLETPAS